jgi:hypothetical protein
MAGIASVTCAAAPANDRERPPVIVFLDFDGVLHPDPCTDRGRLFEHAPRLAQSLADFAEVGLVLSTAWRTVKPFDELLELLPADLGQRIVDITPTFGDFEALAPLTPYRRQAECVQWLHQNRLQDEAWLALDDRPDGFAPYCENLITCHPEFGFDREIQSRLRSALERYRRRCWGEVDLQIG